MKSLRLPLSMKVSVSRRNKHKWIHHHIDGESEFFQHSPNSVVFEFSFFFFFKYSKKIEFGA